MPRPTNLPLKIFCLGDFPVPELLLDLGPISEKFVQNRGVEAHGYRGGRGPVVVVIVVQRKVWVCVVRGAKR